MRHRGTRMSFTFLPLIYKVTDTPVMYSQLNKKRVFPKTIAMQRLQLTKALYMRVSTLLRP